MIDHVSIGVRDLAAASRFYEAVLAPLGYKKLRDEKATVGFGKTYNEFWLNLRPNLAKGDTGVHVCLRARGIDAVEAFHATALQMGATSEGTPGPRPEYSKAYFAAFIRDADGNVVEAVTFVEPAA